MARRCCAKTQKGTRCKLSNAFTGEFCHIHAHKAPEAEPEAPVVEPEAEPEAEPDAETEQFLHNFTEKIAEVYGEPVDIHPRMEANTWDLIAISAKISKEEFLEALEWAVFEQLSLCKPGIRKFDFVFHKSFPMSLRKQVFLYQGDDMNVSFNQQQLRVQTSFVKK
jgi:hypothetical protein